MPSNQSDSAARDPEGNIGIVGSRRIAPNRPTGLQVGGMGENQ
jgi:hypothetical protein